MQCLAFKELSVEEMKRYGIELHSIYEDLEKVVINGGKRKIPLEKWVKFFHSFFFLKNAINIEIDSIYGIYIYCEQHGMEKYMKFTMFEKETKNEKYRDNPYRAVNFSQDENGKIVCPKNKIKSWININSQGSTKKFMFNTRSTTLYE